MRGLVQLVAVVFCLAAYAEPTGPTVEVSGRPPKKLVAGVSKGSTGDFEGIFPTDCPRIYARWQGVNLRVKAKIRAVWIAEDVGDVAAPNYKIDEAAAIATAPDARGVFTLSCPDDGWAPGKYRVEFYVDEKLEDTVKLVIIPAEAPPPPFESKILESE